MIASKQEEMIANAKLVIDSVKLGRAVIAIGGYARRSRRRHVFYDPDHFTVM